MDAQILLLEKRLRPAQSGDELLWQVAALQDTDNRLCGSRGTETEVDMWLQNHTPTVDNPELETPWTKAGLQPPPSNIQTKIRYDALEVFDICEQGKQGESAPGAHGGYCKKKC